MERGNLGRIIRDSQIDKCAEFIDTTTGNNPYGPDTSTFTPIDKDSYSEHNSVADEYKSIGLGAADSVQQATFGVGELATYGWQGLNVGTGAISYGYEKIFGVSPFGGMLEYKPEIWEGLREDCEKLSSACHNYLENLAPHKNSFEGAKGITDLIMAMDGMRGMVGSIKNIPKIFSGGIKVVGFANGALGIAKDLNVAAVAGAVGKTATYGLLAGSSIDNIVENSSGSKTNEEAESLKDVEKNSNDKEVVKDSETTNSTKTLVDEGEQFTNGRRNKLKPNIRYKTGEYDYFYETDGNGRISKFETDNLQLTSRGERLSHSKNTPGKIKGKDHAGHLAGDRFGGSPKIDNLVSQLSEVNLSQYKKIENEWERAIDAELEVTVDIQILYEGNSLRPSKFLVNYTIDGEAFSVPITN